MAEYRRVRNEQLGPMYDLTCGVADLESLPPEMLALYRALRYNSVKRDRYFGTWVGPCRFPKFTRRRTCSRFWALPQREREPANGRKRLCA
jgi:hypothetical protein